MKYREKPWLGGLEQGSFFFFDLFSSRLIFSNIPSNSLSIILQSSSFKTCCSLTQLSQNFFLQLFLQIYLPFLEELIFFAPKLTASPLLERARSEEKRRIPWKKEVALKAFIRIPSLLFLFQSLFCAQWTPTASTGLSSQRNRPRPCDINGASPGVASMDA